MANTRSPRLSASATVSTGVSLPSEAVVCTCRSMGQYRSAPPVTHRLLRVIDYPRFANDRHLDLPRVVECVLDALDDVAVETPRGVLVYLVGLDHDADLAPRLKGVRLLHTLEAERHIFQRLDALDVVVHVFAPRTRSRRRYGI